MVASGSMARVYVRKDVLTVPHADRDGQRSPLAPDAGNALDALQACGWEVVVLATADAGELPEAFAQEGPAHREEPGAWLLTNEVADARWARRFGLRTALVGPTGGEGSQPQRCDFAFRDLRTAALEILARDVVSTPPDV
jgi:hypothetical protein